ncbi:hypothetical protein GCM10022422_21000 [Flavobacterium ginsengisoli]|uniref:DUF4412 domain-containing protein n=1 Tax=Flavobacterium ginsengisoli TaxID=871694 RepID=A0ABP7FGH0_9FLAO|nr:hypothetical protein [Flavobacterium ginsengisoli]
MKLKTVLNISLFLLSFGKTIAQNDDLSSLRYQFSKEVFEKKYSRKYFERFKGKILILNENSIQFDEKTLILTNVNNDYISIFTKGVFYPNIITENSTSILKTKEELSKMTKDEKMIYNFNKTDSIRISNFHELKRLNPNPQTKRFVFWRYRKGMVNPTECYFELENKKASTETSLADFIENSQLTFYYRGTIII